MDECKNLIILADDVTLQEFIVEVYEVTVNDILSEVFSRTMRIYFELPDLTLSGDHLELRIVKGKVNIRRLARLREIVCKLDCDFETAASICINTQVTRLHLVDIVQTHFMDQVLDLSVLSLYPAVLS